MCINITNDGIEKLCKSNFYVGGKDWLKDFCKSIGKEECVECIKTKGYEDKQEEFKKITDKIRLYLKNYLQLDNVSFLFGAGSSIHLGSISIRQIPKQIEDKINEDTNIKKLFNNLIKQFSAVDIVSRTKDEEINIPLEQFLNYLLGLKFVLEKSKKVHICDELKEKEDIEKLDMLIKIIKQELFKLCDLDSISLEENRFAKSNPNIKQIMQDNGKYYYHKKLIKALLQRPLNLKRVNIFTTNYDLAFENSFDELGVQYIDGFTGFHKRTFKPESYDYDIYYPGTTTEGKVRRVERVIRYFKLHGSISWLQDKLDTFNQYGLVEKPIDLIRNNLELAGNLIIYPTSCKKEYTLDFPYSELFRQFAATITQSQSVLFCIGYSFCDEHINDIIYQALSIPSFTLVVIDYLGTKNPEIDRLKDLKDPRIIILQGEYLGDFKSFATDIMPNFHEIEMREKVTSTLRKLYESGIGEEDVSCSKGA
ncbi:hypothetical protein FQB35_12900 [Crassaminicella thermophila]|uniref:Uncharacterized protein n=1 Tax=Crassaminicella thermophila TaxID=2599308 RepID=A0A5C0SGQ1_CRATE|nr:SIR2 family protein [Crassaminicella thermophila]QEK13142.1 hypothetical protein FQB35_12900 [Crassaminicella thermophila]